MVAVKYGPITKYYAKGLTVRRTLLIFGLLLAAGMTALLFIVPFVGVEINGARRWISLGMQFQPSEFVARCAHQSSDVEHVE